jgi:hypothetical protein
MRDGLENDDKYRMVEDEFLTVAQKFTVHLHAAEYKRQQAQVKVRNADAIRSISRPVTTKMPEQTKRKVEAVERSLAQRKALEALAGNNSKDSEESDSELPYVGTALHSFMDTPRKKAVSLLRTGSISMGTRAAAGFKQRLTQTSSPARPSGVKKEQTADKVSVKMEESETESDADEDLDLPIAPPQLGVSNKNRFSMADSLLGSRSITQAPKLNIAIVSHSQPQKTNHSELGVSTKISQPESKITPKIKREAHSRVRIFSTDVHLPSNEQNKANAVPPRLSRLDYIRKQQLKQEAEAERERKLDVIPSFL